MKIFFFTLILSFVINFIFAQPTKPPVKKNIEINIVGKIDTIAILKEIENNMVFVKGATFTMGCTFEQEGDCKDSEIPAHDVILKDFYISKYEVTQKQWRAIMGDNPSAFQGCDSCPIENVSFLSVQEFIKKLNLLSGKNYGLPVETQWEYAARGGITAVLTDSTTPLEVLAMDTIVTFKYAGGNNLEELAFFDANSENKTHIVGSKKPNSLGLYDMSGNVWELCDEWYISYWVKTQKNQNEVINSKFRSCRGGSWRSTAPNCRVSNRGGSTPEKAADFLGFRLVLNP